MIEQPQKQTQCCSNGVGVGIDEHSGGMPGQHHHVGNAVAPFNAIGGSQPFMGQHVGNACQDASNELCVAQEGGRDKGKCGKGYGPYSECGEWGGTPTEGVPKILGENKQ